MCHRQKLLSSKALSTAQTLSAHTGKYDSLKTPQSLLDVLYASRLIQK